VDVVRHDYVGVQDIVFQVFGVVVDCFNDHVCNGWLAEVDISSAGCVEESVHGCECLT
jgi:hypothetical protein